MVLVIWESACQPWANGGLSLRIVAIPLPSPTIGLDRVIWGGTTIGAFILKSVYGKIQKESWNPKEAIWQFPWKFQGILICLRIDGMVNVDRGFVVAGGEVWDQNERWILGFNRFYFCKTFPIPSPSSESSPSPFLPVHQRQPLLLILGVLFINRMGQGNKERTTKQFRWTKPMEYIFSQNSSRWGPKRK
ncbi:hypothetical protein PVK06_026990 [Gossypium arboreum]|uniref:Uncharacterized protein n=1 Tax=Gossypium arboreum TaxID=29729 RepID=A0ABR0NZF9_GOSAR|nr:hypothetical protein PVK06_026990 [Gossypium arboreum]